jgi:hypothetical protein
MSRLGEEEEEEGTSKAGWHEDSEHIHPSRKEAEVPLDDEDGDDDRATAVKDSIDMPDKEASDKEATDKEALVCTREVLSVIRCKLHYHVEEHLTGLV